MKKILTLGLMGLFALNLNATKISEEQCNKENFIYTSGECIEYRLFEGDTNEHIMILVHGIWDEGTNTLGRYAPFAETMNLNTDLTTIAVALPGYSGSSTNNISSLSHKTKKNQAATKEYVLFVGDIVDALKKRYEATTVTYVGHSAGARLGGTLMGLKPDLIQNIALVGGKYEIRAENQGKGLISLSDVIDDVNKDANFLFVYGTEDKISKPEVTTSFFEVAKTKGLKAKLVKVEGAAHIDLDMTDESVEAIVEMIEGE